MKSHRYLGEKLCFLIGDTCTPESRVIKRKGTVFSFANTAGRSFDITLVLSEAPAYADIVCQCPINVADEDTSKESTRGRTAEEKRRGAERGERELFLVDSVLKELSLLSHLFSSSIRFPSWSSAMFSGSSVNPHSSTSTRCSIVRSDRFQRHPSRIWELARTDDKLLIINVEFLFFPLFFFQRLPRRPIYRYIGSEAVGQRHFFPSWAFIKNYTRLIKTRLPLLLSFSPSSSSSLVTISLEITPRYPNWTCLSNELRDIKVFFLCRIHRFFFFERILQKIYKEEIYAIYYNTLEMVYRYRRKSIRAHIRP